MKKYLFIFLFYPIIINSQTNLIYNPNLIEYDTRYCDASLFIGFGDTIVDYWHCSTEASSDYFNSCEPTNNLSVPVNYIDIVNDPSSLDGYLGLGCYFSNVNYSEYISTHLKERLIKDSIYILSYKVYNTAISNVNTNIGVCFEKDSIFRPFDTIISTQYPEYTYMSDAVIPKGSWQTVSFIITPHIDSLQYLTIGIFPLQKPLLVDSSEWFDTMLNKITYFFIDDVELIKDTNYTKPDTSCSVAIPSAFTPNNDGLNDEWKPLIQTTCEDKITNYLLRIFNRWGEVVFTTHDKNETWEGINNEIGTYVYYLQYDDFDITKKKKGSVELIR